MSTTTSDFLRHLRTLAARQAIGTLTDQQLLELFRREHSEASFAVLVQRHGPMVLSVCRRVLHQVQDVEDAFQATFLVLAKKASTLRQPPLLGSWLHGVAYHVALRLKAKTQRRTTHEQRVAPPPSGDAMADITWRELRWVLDEELQKMPEQYRAPLVLCYLEARTQDEAARHLGWSKNTFSRRMNQARQMLARRLTRRGLTLPAVLTAPLLIENTASAALPTLLMANTVRAGLAAATGQATAGLISAQAATMTEGGVGSLLTKKVSLAVALLTSLILCLGGLLAYRVTDAPSTPSPQSPPAQSASKGESIEIKGRVLDPEGKPFAGARLFLLSGGNAKKGDKLLRATTDKEGRFGFTAQPSELGPQGKGKIVATAKGWGLDWTDINAGEKNEEITLRLVVDDVPIEGRVLDLEGKPVAGVVLRVLRVGKMPGSADLKTWLDKNIDMRKKGTYLNENELDTIRADLLDPPAPVGADGRFRLAGFGRDRVVRLDIEGQDIVWRKMWAVTRPGPARGFIPGIWGVYAAKFEYLAAPCKPIVGIVREKGSGQPLAGINVGSVMHGDVETTTDNKGRYRLVGVAKNPRYAVVAEGQYHFNCTKRDVTDTPGLEPITVNFELERGIPIRGRVRNKVTGEPVHGSVYYCARADNPHLKDFKEIGSFAHIHLRSANETPADGSFTVLGIPGPGVLCVRADNGSFIQAKPVDEKGAPLQTVPDIVLTGYHALTPVNVSEEDPESPYQEIALDPGRSLKGTVVGPDGKPLVDVRMLGLTSTWTDSDGKAREDADFTVTGLEPGRERTLIFCQEEKRLGKLLHLRGDEKGPLTVRLEPLGTLTGRMVDTAGRPLSGLTVRIRQAHSAFDRKTTTDSDGKFRIEGLLPQQKFLLAIAQGDPWERRSIPVYFADGLIVESGMTKELGDLQPKPFPRK